MLSSSLPMLAPTSFEVSQSMCLGLKTNHVWTTVHQFQQPSISEGTPLQHSTNNASIFSNSSGSTPPNLRAWRNYFLPYSIMCFHPKSLLSPMFSFCAYFLTILFSVVSGTHTMDSVLRSFWNIVKRRISLLSLRPALAIRTAGFHAPISWWPPKRQVSPVS